MYKIEEQTKYPYVLFPPYHRNNKFFHDLKPTKPKFKFEEPVLIKTEERGSGWFSFMMVCIGMMVIGVLAIKEGGVVFFTPGFWGALISYFLYKRSKNKEVGESNNNLRKYNREVEQYNFRVEAYRDEIKRYDEKVSILSYGVFFKKERAIQYLVENSDTYLIDKGYHENVLKGSEEEGFYTYLHKIYGDKIQIGKCLKENYGKEYYPDFVYKDLDNGVIIDIEIDEPYSYKKKEPIHYIGANYDRDLFFVENYWGVIRFSENQIKYIPDLCVSYISEFIDSIKNDLEIKEWGGKYDKRWTKKKAKKKIKSNSRSKSLAHKYSPDNNDDYDLRDVFDFARHYYSLGLNVTCIHSTVNKYNKVVKDKLKHPCHRYKYLGKDYRQTEEDFNSYEWDKAVGLGTVSGFDRLVLIDIDGCSDIDFLFNLLKDIGLPYDYRWISQSGSNNGYHIYIRTNRPTDLDKIYAVSTYDSSTIFSNIFDKIELLWHTHIVMPPSLHKSGGHYSFVQGTPVEDIRFVSIKKVLKCIKSVVDISSVKHGKEYKEETE